VAAVRGGNVAVHQDAGTVDALLAVIYQRRTVKSETVRIPPANPQTLTPTIEEKVSASARRS
jgi:hypothetical protein